MLRRTWLLTVSGSLSVTDFLSSLWIIEIISFDLNACALFKARNCEYKIRKKVASGFDKLLVSKKLHLRTLEKCRKHSPAARVFYISLVFSNARRVLSQCNTRLMLLYLSINS